MDITTQERCRSYVLPNLDSFRPNGIINNKNEIDNSIKLVETAVNTLAEEQALPLVLMTHSISLSNAHRCLP